MNKFLTLSQPILTKEFGRFLDTLYAKRNRHVYQNAKFKEIYPKNKIKRIYKFYNRGNKKPWTLSSPLFPSGGRFCYPYSFYTCKPSNYDWAYIEFFPSWTEFKKNYDDWLRINDFFHTSPGNDKTRNYIHKYLIVWLLISHLNSEFIKNFKENTSRFITELSLVLNANYYDVYNIVSKYLYQVNHVTQLDVNDKQTIVSNYRNSYCQICRKYLCVIHFFDSVECLKINSNKHEIVSIKQGKLSGNRTFLNKSLKKKDNPNDKELLFSCKYNRHQCYLNTNCKENDKDNPMIVITDTMSKLDWYIWLSFVTSDIFSRSCLWAYIFNYKYSCISLHKVLTVFSQAQNVQYFDNYLSKAYFDNITLPKISLEKLYFNYCTANVSNARVKTNNECASPTKKQNANLITKNVKNHYIPCSHTSHCCPDVCECHALKWCDKFCVCFTQKISCPYKIKGCSCTNGCDSSCPCFENNRECDPAICGNCTNYKTCSNMKIFFRRFKKCALGISNWIDQYGWFTLENIKRGDLIGVYYGEIVETSELGRIDYFNDYFGRTYGFTLSNKYEISATYCGNKMRYINHSSFGYENVQTKSVYVRGIPYVGFYAWRDLIRGKELFFDYQIDQKSNVRWLEEYNKKYKGRWD